MKPTTVAVRDPFCIHRHTTRKDSDGEAIESNDDGEANLVGDVVKSVLSSASESVAATNSSSPSPGTTNDISVLPFQRLFQSTLQRAYSTTMARGSTTLDDDTIGKNTTATTEDNDDTVPQIDKNGDVSAVSNSILDATIVETRSNRRSSSGDGADGDKTTVASSVNSVLDATIINTRDRNKYSNRTETKKQKQSQNQGHTQSKGDGEGQPHPQKRRSNSEPSKSKSKSSPPNHRYEFPFSTSYKSHPALNNVALAHALWASVVRPNFDSVIDATCGNGNDSIVLAEILFGDSDVISDGSDTDQMTFPELLCLDVQSRACERTTMALREVLPPSIQVVTENVEAKAEAESEEEGNSSSSSSHRTVRVLQASHEILPRPTDDSSVGLIVYNLGWLPGSNTNSSSSDDSNGKDCVTTMETTLLSLADATSLLRVGGMLSVVTYPRTGPDEDIAVKLFVTCLALLSSRTQTWQDGVATFVANNSKNNDAGESNTEAIAKHVSSAMESVVARGDQTWRVSQHDKLGMNKAPILFTATRIK